MYQGESDTGIQQVSGGTVNKKNSPRGKPRTGDRSHISYTFILYGQRSEKSRKKGSFGLPCVLAKTIIHRTGREYAIHH